ncbi:MAG: hypothetical protein ACREHF_06665 [Rhizomicrobium sp.]
MQNRVQEALRQALEAREKAFLAGDSRLKVDWLKVAEMWDAIAAEYRAIEACRVDSPGG